MPATKVQITLDDRLVALLGDARSANVREAIIQLYGLDRTTLTPKVSAATATAPKTNNDYTAFLRVFMLEHTVPAPWVVHGGGPMMLRINAEHAGKLRKMTGLQQPEAAIRAALYKRIDDAYKAKYGTEEYRPEVETLHIGAIK